MPIYVIQICFIKNIFVMQIIDLIIWNYLWHMYRGKKVIFNFDCADVASDEKDFRLINFQNDLDY